MDYEYYIVENMENAMTKEWKRQKTKDIEERTDLISYLKDAGIVALFHYVPLHSSIAGKRYGRFNGVDKYTTSESNRLVRLPMYYSLTRNDIEYVVEKLYNYYRINFVK